MIKKILSLFIQFAVGFLVLFLINKFLFKIPHSFSLAFFGSLLGILFTSFFNWVIKKMKKK